MEEKRLLNIFLITMLIVSMLTMLVPSVSAPVSPYSPADKISVLPGERIYETDVECFFNGTTFTVDLYVHNITDCGGYDFWLYYDANLLEVTNINIDTGTPSTPSQIAPAPSGRIETDMSTSGIVKFSVVWKFGVLTYSGSGTAAQITFEIIYCPPQIVSGPLQINNTVNCDLALDRTWTKAYDEYGDDIYFAEFDDGYYEYTTIGEVLPAPVPDFTWTPTYPIEGQEVTCTDTSSPNGGEINAWLWEIEGPATNTTALDGSVMKFRCLGAGDVNVTLTVWDTEGLNATVTKQINVSARYPPVPDFTWTPTYPIEGQEVTCTDTSSPNGGEINAWLWEIEGPATNTTALDGSVMKFRCLGAGDVNVTLTVWDTEGLNATVTKQINVLERGRARLFVDPSVTTVTIGETFKTGVIINDVTDLYSFEFKLSYNTTILDAIEVWVMWPDSYVINETAGIIWVNATSPYPYPFSGNGTLVAITFTPTEFGSCVLDLHNTTLLDFYFIPLAHDVLDGYVAVIPIHDVAIINVTPSSTEVYPTWKVLLDIKVVVINEGNINETFDVTVYYNSTPTQWILIESQPVVDLAVDQNKTLTFSWNVTGLSVGTYVINATTSIIPDEVNPEDNTLTNTVKMKLPGDVDGDCAVDGADMRRIQLAMFTTPGDPSWNSQADLDGDEDINGADQRICQLYMFEWC